MKPFMGALAASLWLTACDGLIVVIGTGPSPLAASSTVVVSHVDGGTIIVGQPIHGVVTAPGGGVNYRFVATRSGTLFLGVSWDRSLGTVNVRFASSMLPSPAGGGPFAAHVPVVAGQAYTVEIADGAAQAAPTLNLPFTVTTALE